MITLSGHGSQIQRKECVEEMASSDKVTPIQSKNIEGAVFDNECIERVEY